MYVPNIYCMEKRLKFGEFSCNVTQKLNGLDDPIVKLVLGHIGNLDWNDYKLYVHGSILKDSPANDIDLTITGPQDPTRVNYLLRECIKIGYSHNVQVDIKYLLSGEIFDYETHKPGETHTVTHAHYKPQIELNGKVFKYAKSFNGYWINQKSFPTKKSHLSPHSPQLIQWH